ncbi:MAG TPA: hotdog fold thioesterase [Anaerolineae bacterium]|nr:hotdog fold thioesterase [Anaerolineae bacterium]
MSIWYTYPTLEALQQRAAGTMIAHLGIEYLEVGDDFLRARMPVDARTVQPFGILHGGASMALAETLGSTAANWCVDFAEKMCVGLDINANHVRAARSGYVIGTSRPVHLGSSTHVWEIRIENEQAQLICLARLTMAVLKRTSLSQ